MKPIAEVAGDILLTPAPVFVVDTCNFLDLFRGADKRGEWRVKVDELRTAAELLQACATRPHVVHLVVPELVPREYADNAGGVQGELETWVQTHDANRAWLADAATLFAVPLPPPVPVHASGVHARCRQLADDLLAAATVLARDRGCLDRAITRVIEKRRPSRNNQVKDSMNLEQTLELCRQLTDAGFDRAKVFVSSNSKDFAADTNSSVLEAGLQSEFDQVGLKYFGSLQAAVGNIRASGELG